MKDFGREVKDLLYYLKCCSKKSYVEEFESIKSIASKLERLTSKYIWCEREKIERLEKIDELIKYFAPAGSSHRITS